MLGIAPELDADTGVYTRGVVRNSKEGGVHTVNVIGSCRGVLCGLFVEYYDNNSNRIRKNWSFWMC